MVVVMVCVLVLMCVLLVADCESQGRDERFCNHRAGREGGGGALAGMSSAIVF